MTTERPFGLPAGGAASPLAVQAIRLLLPALAGLLVLSTLPARAQEAVQRVTLEEALGLFARNNLELRLSRSGADEMAGLARQAAAYPNPSLALTHEPLFGRGGSQSESYLNLSQRLLWPGLRQARTEAARELAAAAQARVEADSLRLAAEVARAYVAAAAAQDRARYLGTVTSVFQRADTASAALVREGDISGYDVRRLRVERVRYENTLARAELEVRTARRRLALLILPDGAAAEVSPTTSLAETVAGPAFEEALQQAATRRPEMVQARAEVEAARAAFDVAVRERLPDPTVTAGFKRQSNGLKGLFLGVSAPLPVFDRNRGQIQAQQARLDAAQTRLLLFERQIVHDVRQAYDRYAALRDQVARTERTLLAEADNLLRIARVSYSEGEMSLLELLDAAGASRDARITTIDLLEDFWTSYYDLVRATAGPFVSPPR